VDNIDDDSGLSISSGAALASEKDFEHSTVYENKNAVLNPNCETTTCKKSLAVRSSIITTSTVLINIRLQVVEDKQETSDNNCSIND